MMKPRELKKFSLSHFLMAVISFLQKVRATPTTSTQKEKKRRENE
jgi:hypothetical protein